ncbi:(R)-mandelonitrile lyase 2-like [Pyrus ussuriensis x Pyrus communis]|uniref:(R)-mandelonitrile lyase n=1 Tax=Pyrus ussuriensis x Pyrus communis TaxID=2448454 RepID=A0A5N5G8Q0_9ROSA|nr:(R)-mandelonitrile lyase 2-like [Pyrus ussuriensis x Pyrus communis]
MQESTVSAILLVLLLFVLHLQSGVHSLAPPHAHYKLHHRHFGYLKFVYNATDLPLGKKYDFIVVGGGTSGCPSAATLSAKYSVLVLEGGSLPTAYPNLLNQDGFLYNLQQEDDGKTPVQRIMSEDGIPTVRGRIIGGMSMINAGVHARANISFYNESGIEWDMDLVNKTYKWVENTIVGRPNNSVSGWQSVAQKVFLEAGGYDPNNGFVLDHIEGTRFTADELLNKGDPNNLRVAVHGTVEKIIFSTIDYKLFLDADLSATGVIYRDSNGRSHRALVHDKGEVILSSGTIGSPQLLLLGGIGPKSYLSSLKVPVVLDLPDVGQFMYDNPCNFINILTPNDPLEPSIVTSLAITNNFYQCSISLLPYTTPQSSRTFAHGSLTLNSSFDVTIPPNVKLNYFSDSMDLANCVASMKSIGNVLRTETLKPYKVWQTEGIEGFKFLGQPLPNNRTDDASFEKFCKDTVASYWHYHGGCLVGKVVDGGLRVKGINALRVVDSSTFPTAPASHPQGFYLMLGSNYVVEWQIYMGIKILRERSD